jgi:hypothetical protein
MADLTPQEKRMFERVLEMGSGYVLNFSNRSFDEFVHDSNGRDIYDTKYSYGSGSKVNRLGGFWNEESNPVVAKLLGDLLDYMVENGSRPQTTARHLPSRGCEIAAERPRPRDRGGAAAGRVSFAISESAALSSVIVLGLCLCPLP